MNQPSDRSNAPDATTSGCPDVPNSPVDAPTVGSDLATGSTSPSKRTPKNPPLNSQLSRALEVASFLRRWVTHTNGCQSGKALTASGGAFYNAADCDCGLTHALGLLLDCAELARKSGVSLPF